MFDPTMDKVKEEMLLTLAGLGESERALKEEADVQRIDPYRIQDRNGRFLLADLLIQKAQLLISINTWMNRPK